MSKKSKQVIHMCKSMEQTKNVLLLFSEQRPMQQVHRKILTHQALLLQVHRDVCLSSLLS